jgi:hypothetical protein
LSAALDDRPIFVLGRPHSGNTMMAMVLGRHSQIHGSIGESLLFEHLPALAALAPTERARAVTDHLRRAAQPTLDAATVADVRSVLERIATETPEVSIADLMSHGMRHLAKAAGKSYWAQKATSYIFYVDDIFRVFPRARLVFLARNPFDIGASHKRRGTGIASVRSVLAWNRGLRRATAAAAAHPDQFKIVHYEQLVTDGATLLPPLMRFLDLEPEPDQLDVPHVNRSEEKYALRSEDQGLNSSRVYYFRKELTPAEVGLLYHYIDKPVLRQVYPHLAEELATVPTPHIGLRTVGLVKGFGLFAAQSMKAFGKSPRSAADRIAKRLQA